MRTPFINWDYVPDTLSKEQFCKLCHISKANALELLKSGELPCIYNGKKTCCYQIYKKDARSYLESRAVVPEPRAAARGWYSGRCGVGEPKELPDELKAELREYYAALAAGFGDVMTTYDIVRFTGYGRSTVNNWCRSGHLKHFRKRNLDHVPKAFVLDFLCSLRFRLINRKTPWHTGTLRDFNRLRREGLLSREKTSDDNADGGER